MRTQSHSQASDHQRRIEASRARVRFVAHWLDNAVGIPGTRFRFGLDSLIGLVPGVGDFAGLLLGCAILAEGLRVGAPNRVVARMMSNSLVDSVVGAVPLVGDLFDFAFRSNAMNARLLLEHLDTQAGSVTAFEKPVKRGPLVVLILLLPVAVFALAVYGMVAVFHKLYS